MTQIQSLSGLDAACLLLDTEAAPLNVIGTLVLKSPGARQVWMDELRSQVLTSAMRIPLLRRTIVHSPFRLGRPVWRESQDAELARQVHEATLPAPGSDKELAHFLAVLASRVLDRNRPLWELWLVDGLRANRVAVVLKLHHALADGVGATALLMQMLGAVPLEGADHLPDTVQPAVPEERRVLFGDAIRDSLFWPGRVIRNSRRLLGSAAALLNEGARYPELIGHLLQCSQVPHGVFQGIPNSERRVSLARIDMATMKRMKDHWSVKFNDITLTVCCLGLRRYLLGRGELPDGPLVAVVPISVRRQEDGIHGNRLSLLGVRLPVHLEDPEHQLRAIEQDTLCAKRIHEVLGPEILLRCADATAPSLLRVGRDLYEMLSDRIPPTHNLVISNLAGPDQQIEVAGAPVFEAYPLGPALFGAGLNLTVASYAGSLHIGAVASPQAVPDLDGLVAEIGNAVGELDKFARWRN